MLFYIQLGSFMDDFYSVPSSLIALAKALFGAKELDFLILHTNEIGEAGWRCNARAGPACAAAQNAAAGAAMEHQRGPSPGTDVPG